MGGGGTSNYEITENSYSEIQELQPLDAIPQSGGGKKKRKTKKRKLRTKKRKSRTKKKKSRTKKRKLRTKKKKLNKKKRTRQKH